MKSAIVVCSTSTGYADLSLADVDDLCMNRGFKLTPEGYCRYHYVIARNGDIHVGKSEELNGWHHDKHDLNCILVAIVGNSDNCTSKQYDSLYKVLSQLEEDYPAAKIVDASETGINETGVLLW